MNKRIKKKIGNRYNHLKRAKRQKHKRKGIKCFAYELVPMGNEDKIKFDRLEYDPGYSGATHWLVDVVYDEVMGYYNGRVHLIRIFPCTNKGGSDDSWVRIISCRVDKPENMFPILEKVVDTMKSDRFMDTYWDTDPDY